MVEKLLLAERMGWTLEYIDSMDADDYYYAVVAFDAIEKARNWMQRKATAGAGKKR